MDVEAYAQHVESPRGRGHTPTDACTGAAGGAACGDLVRISVEVDHRSPHGTVCDAGFDASGCGAAVAAGSAAVTLVRGMGLLEAARVGAAEIAAELGGLHPSKLHAAELAADALHRALGWAARRQAQLAQDSGRTLVAMSGGVDSAVAALLVCEQSAGAATAGRPAATGGASQPGATMRGWTAGTRGPGHPGAGGAHNPVVAVTLELWSDPENDGERSCCSAQAVRFARQTAHGMGLPHLSIDLREEFAAGVVRPWLDDHRNGLTPNPCVRCNGHVRLDAMLDLADRLGAQALATGHYARVEVAAGVAAVADPGAAGAGAAGTGAAGAGVGGGGVAVAEARGPLLRAARDERKDQSYALAALSPSSLARMCFPLGDFTKEQVRARAAQAGLAVARRPDSQDLCFLAGTRQERFLARHGGLRPRRGAVVGLDGRKLGEHEGVHTVTIGQRRGVGVSGAAEPLFVVGTDPAANTVTVGPRESLRCELMSVRDVTLHRDASLVDGVKVRYRGRRMACRLEGELAAGRHPHADVRLLAPAERTAPGQIACLYAGEQVIGHGTIA